MKKLFIRLLLVLVVLLVAAAIAAHFFLDGVIKRGVETYGPRLAKVDVKLKAVNLMLLSGSGKVHGLVIGNPQGFSSPSAISVGSTSVSLQPASLLQDKVIVNSINIQAPEITFETGLNVKENNLNKILANLEESLGEDSSTNGPTPPPDPAANAGKKLQIDEFLITGAKVHVTVTAFGGKSATLPLPEIRLKNLGQGPEGITAAEVSKKVLEVIEREAAQVAVTAIADLSKGAVYLSRDIGKAATNTVDKAVDKASKSIGDLFKKK